MYYCSGKPALPPESTTTKTGTDNHKTDYLYLKTQGRIRFWSQLWHHADIMTNRILQIERFLIRFRMKIVQRKILCERNFLHIISWWARKITQKNYRQTKMFSFLYSVAWTAVSIYPDVIMEIRVSHLIYPNQISRTLCLMWYSFIQLLPISDPLVEPFLERAQRSSGSPVKRNLKSAKLKCFDIFLLSFFFFAAIGWLASNFSLTI